MANRKLTSRIVEHSPIHPHYGFNTYIRKMQKIFLLLSFILITTFSFSQSSIRGIIKDDTGNFVEAATVELYSSNQNKIVSADERGTFSFTNLTEDNKYLLQISAIGYQQKVIAFKFQSDTLLNIVLTRNFSSLNDVTITAKVKLINIEPNKTVVNLAANSALIGNSISEILSKIPGVLMNGDKVSIPGKGEVQLMKDGRLIQLAGKDLVNYLKSISVSNVSKIEIITNPSAVYDAVGNAGLINIITKRNKQKGYSGSIETGYKQWQNYPGMDASGNINYNKDKWNFFANANMFRIRHKYGFRWNEFYPNRSWDMSDTGDYKQQNITFNVGADHQISRNSTIGFSAGYNRYYEGGADFVRSHFYNQTNQVDSFLTSYATYVPLAKTQTYNLSYKTKLDTNGTTLSLNAGYLNFYRTDTSDFTGKTFMPDGQLIAPSTTLLYNSAMQNINIYTFRADIEVPTSFMKLQFGGKSNFISTFDRLKYYRMNGTSKIYDQDISNEYLYTENTQALYIDAAKNADKWAFDVGLRGELTQTKGLSIFQNQHHTSDYFKLFPNVLVSYKNNDDNTFSFTFNKRINRPTFWNLNPYRSPLTAYSYYEGNPFLQPEYNNNFQIAHTYKSKLTSSLFVALTNNSFADITIANVDTNLVLRTTKNYANSIRFGISEAYTFSTFHWWNSSNVLNIYHTDGKSRLDYVEGQKGWGAYFSSSNNFYFNEAKTFSASVNFWYQFPEVIQVNKGFSYYNLDVGFSAELLKDKLLLNTNLQDIFGTSAPSYANTVNNIYQQYSVLQLNRNFSLTLIFKFGKKNAASLEHQNSNQEERERI